MNRSFALRGAVSPSFAALRGSLLAALGLSVAACGGTVTGSNGGGGAGTTTGEAGGGNGGNGTGGNGTGGSATGGSTGGSGTGGTVVELVCKDPKPILQPNGADTGFVRCADGSIDRVAPATCAVTTKDTCQGTEMTLDCMTAADCTDHPHGSCQTYSGGAPGPEITGCGCTYQCASDAECDTGSVCACAGVASPTESFCIAAVDCELPADCPSGECGYSEYDNGCWTEQRTYCRGGADTCRADAECAATNKDCGKTDGKDAWSCLDKNCIIGRPLLVGDSLRFAPAARRADWGDEDLRPETGTLSHEVRAALAAHFTAMAAMEHASIGSFARFSLELLAIGAPPSLLQATHEAAADEIAHARLAYSLAAAYSLEPVGPGPLSVAGVVPGTDEREILEALVREACVGETVAAAEALFLSTSADDPVLQAVYARVAEDEARHAELGWRTLAWMLSRRPGLIGAAEEAFAAAVEAIGSAPLVASGVVSPRHGLLSSEALGDLRKRAAGEIVEPCRRALLAASGAGAATLDNGSRAASVEGSRAFG